MLETTVRPAIVAHPQPAPAFGHYPPGDDLAVLTARLIDRLETTPAPAARRVEPVITLDQADIDNLADYMAEWEGGYEDEAAPSRETYRAAALDFLERAIDDLCDDPTFIRRHFAYRWKDALERAQVRSDR